MPRPVLRLPEPYGGGTGDNVSLTCTGPVSDLLEDILWRYSCYPPALAKIRSCLEHSGRYDCELQSSWFRRAFVDVTEDLAEIGISLTVVRLTKMDTKPLSKERARPKDWGYNHPELPKEFRRVGS